MPGTKTFAMNFTCDHSDRTCLRGCVLKHCTAINHETIKFKADPWQPLVSVMLGDHDGQSNDGKCHVGAHLSNLVIFSVSVLGVQHGLMASVILARERNGTKTWVCLFSLDACEVKPLCQLPPLTGTRLLSYQDIPTRISPISVLVGSFLSFPQVMSTRRLEVEV
jgi:hypothetical protein